MEPGWHAALSRAFGPTSPRGRGDFVNDPDWNSSIISKSQFAF